MPSPYTPFKISLGPSDSKCFLSSWFTKGHLFTPLLCVFYLHRPAEENPLGRHTRHMHRWMLFSRSHRMDGSVKKVLTFCFCFAFYVLLLKNRFLGTLSPDCFPCQPLARVEHLVLFSQIFSWPCMYCIPLTKTCHVPGLCKCYKEGEEECSFIQFVKMLNSGIGFERGNNFISPGRETTKNAFRVVACLWMMENNLTESWRNVQIPPLCPPPKKGQEF